MSPRDPPSRAAPLAGALAALGLAALASGFTARADDGAAPAKDPAAPRIEFDRETQDWGTVKQEQDLVTEFTVRNAGGAPLHVKEVRADCGCSKPRMDVREIPPGGTATISVTFHTYRYTGPMAKRVKVASDDPVRPEVELRLLLDVSGGLVLDHNLYFGPVLAGSQPTATARVQWKEGAGAPFRVTRVESPGLEPLTVTSKAFDAPPWHGTEVTATFAKPAAIGNVTGAVIVRTDSAEAPRVQIPVTAIVSGRVWVDTRTISVGMLPFGRGRDVAVGVRGFTDDVELGEVTVRATKGRVRPEAKRLAGRPKEWTLLVRLPEDAEPGIVEDVVEVSASALSDEPPARIAVSGQVLPKPAPPVPAR